MKSFKDDCQQLLEKITEAASIKKYYLIRQYLHDIDRLTSRAIIAGDLESVKYILENGLVEVNSIDVTECGESLLGTAVGALACNKDAKKHQNYCDICAYLLERGANPCLPQNNEEGDTPMHIAARCGANDFLLMLASNEEYKEKAILAYDRVGRTPLYATVEEDNVVGAWILVKLFEFEIDVCDNDGLSLEDFQMNYDSFKTQEFFQDPDRYVKKHPEMFKMAETAARAADKNQIEKNNYNWEI